MPGCGGIGWCFLAWWGAFFGPFDSPPATRLMVLSITLLAAAVQVFLTAFLVAVMEAGDRFPVTVTCDADVRPADVANPRSGRPSR